MSAPFGSDDENDGMSFDKIKAYLSNPETIGPAIKNSVAGGLNSSDNQLATDMLKIKNNKDYQPSPEEVQNQIAQNQMLQSAAMGSVGGMNMKPNLGSAGGQVIENMNPSRFKQNLSELFSGRQAASAANDAEAVGHFDNTMTNMINNNEKGRIHTAIPENAFSKIKSYLSN